MKIEDLLREDGTTILDEASAAVARLDHYRRDGEETTRRRLAALYDHVSRAVRTRDLDGLVEHVRRIARERHAAGFDQGELQAAFSALEEAIWRRALTRLPPSELAWGLGLVATALGHGKGEVARAFVALAPSAHAPAIDLTPVFQYAGRYVQDRPVEELVYPV